MNKSLLIVLLAICLVSVHAFVKRDAPAPASTESALSNVQKNLNNIAEKISQDIKENFNADKLKKDFNDFVDKVSDALKPKTA